MRNIQLLKFGRGGEIRTPNRLGPGQVPFLLATPRLLGGMSHPPGGQQRGAAALPKPCYGRVVAVSNSDLCFTGVPPIGVD